VSPAWSGGRRCSLPSWEPVRIPMPRPRATSSAHVLATKRVHRTHEEDRPFATQSSRTHPQLLPRSKAASSGVVGLRKKPKLTMRKSYGFRRFYARFSMFAYTGIKAAGFRSRHGRNGTTHTSAATEFPFGFRIGYLHHGVVREDARQSIGNRTCNQIQARILAHYSYLVNLPLLEWFYFGSVPSSKSDISRS
jgi:hypothetical protein